MAVIQNINGLNLRVIAPERAELVFNAVAAEQLSLNTPVVRLTSAGWVLANSSTAAGVTGTLGMLVGRATGQSKTNATIPTGMPITVLVSGLVFLGENVSLNVTRPLYAAAMAGAIDDAIVANSRCIGYPIDRETMFFCVSSPLPGQY